MKKTTIGIVGILLLLLGAVVVSAGTPIHTPSHRVIDHNRMLDKSDAFHAKWDALTGRNGIVYNHNYTSFRDTIYETSYGYEVIGVDEDGNDVVGLVGHTERNDAGSCTGFWKSLTSDELAKLQKQNEVVGTVLPKHIVYADCDHTDFGSHIVCH
jgi:hypothetical protein